jgi:transcriptional regulator GlxA family with amidase domain
MFHRWNRALIVSSLALRAHAFTGLFPIVKYSRRRPGSTSSPFLSAPSSTDAAAAAMTKKTVLVPIADGSEEIETACITDTLTRFGAHVTIASVGPTLECRMSRGIKVVADCPISDCVGKAWDLIALPGGMPGAEHLRDSADLVSLLQKQKADGKLYAAVCAGT